MLKAKCKISAIIVFLNCLCGIIGLHADVTQSLLDEIHNAQVMQPEVGGVDLQLRGASVDPGWRGATQTFRWNSSNKMAGIALRLSDSQNNLSSPQPYKLYFHSVNPLSGDILRLVADLSFELDGQLIVDAEGKWLVLTFENPIFLVNGAWYGFSLSPQMDESTSMQVLRLSTAGSDSISNIIGAANQVGPSTGVPVASYDISGGTWNPLTFAVMADGDESIPPGHDGPPITLKLFNEDNEQTHPELIYNDISNVFNHIQAIISDINNEYSRIEVELPEGVFRTNRKLTLEYRADNEHPKIHFSGAGAGRTIISGSTELDGEWIREGDYYKKPLEGVARFDKFYVDNVSRPQARYPARNGEFMRTDGTHRGPSRTRMIHFNPDTLGDLRINKNSNIVIFHTWITSIHNIQGICRKTNTICLVEEFPLHLVHRGEVNRRFYLTNVFEGLVEPGTWFYCTETAHLYYSPLQGEDFTKATKSISQIGPTILHIRGNDAAGVYAKNITIENISFMHTNADLSFVKNPIQGEIFQDALVFLEGVRDSVIRNCEFSYGGGHGVWLANGSKDNLIYQNYFHNLDGGGVYIGGGWGVHEKGSTSHIVVENNLIVDSGLLFHGAHGVWIGKSSFNRIRHNEIFNLPYSGISIGWSWGFHPSTANHNLIEYNHVHHISNGNGLSDLGGIYTLGISTGTKIIRNLVHDIWHYPHIAFGNGIYLDQGSAEIHVHENVVYNTGTTNLFLHFGRDLDVSRNFFGFSDGSMVRRVREDRESEISLTENIFISYNGNIYDGVWTDNNWLSESNIFIGNNAFTFGRHNKQSWLSIGNDSQSNFISVENASIGLPDAQWLSSISEVPADIIDNIVAVLDQAGRYGDNDWLVLTDKHLRQERVFEAEPFYDLNIDFENESVNYAPRFGVIVEGGSDKPLVTVQKSDDLHVLEFINTPGLNRTWAPHIGFRFTPTTGDQTIKIKFMNDPESPAEIDFEIRNLQERSIFVTPVRMTVNRKGSVRILDNDVFSVPNGEWIVFELTFIANDDKNCVLTVVHGDMHYEHSFRLPHSHQGINWIGISSLGDQKGRFLVDQVIRF